MENALKNIYRELGVNFEELAENSKVNLGELAKNLGKDLVMAKTFLAKQNRDLAKLRRNLISYRNILEKLKKSSQQLERNFQMLNEKLEVLKKSSNENNNNVPSKKLQEAPTEQKQNNNLNNTSRPRPLQKSHQNLQATLGKKTSNTPYNERIKRFSASL